MPEIHPAYDGFENNINNEDFLLPGGYFFQMLQK